MTQLAPDQGVNEETESSATEAFGARWLGRDHLLNIRVSLPLLFGRYYVVLLAGKELRSAERRKEERQNHPLWTTANTTILFAGGFIVGALAWIGLQNLTIWFFGLGGM